jgi:hypothetical protein
MSGPKDYAPPPRYSMQVFDGKLNQVFQLQSRLKLLCAELAGMSVGDSELSIRFDCRGELGRLRRQIDAALNPLVFDYKGTFGQEVYARVNSEIESKLAALRKQLGLCESVKSEFAGKKADYESYRSYLSFYDNSAASLDDFKSRVLLYLKNNLEAHSPELLAEAADSIGRIRFELKRAAFKFGFGARADAEKQAIVAHVAQKEQEINRVRAETSDRLLRRATPGRARSGADAVRASDAVRAPAVSEEVAALVRKIEALTRRCEDAAAKRGYEEELRRLTGGKSLNQPYFFRELHDRILAAEQDRTAKAEAAALLARLSEEDFHEATRDERAGLVRLCLSLLARNGVTTSEAESLRPAFERLKRRSDELREEDLIRQRELLFLKSQVVLCLENLGYEVMDDLEVIDFEKETDFLLKIRGQGNYLNLKFKDDGSMRYVFQIPERQSELSTDQEKLKLHEMRVTCDEFKSVLRDLSEMGLKIELRSEKPVEAESLVSVPRARMEKLKAGSQAKRQKNQLRGKYRISGAG